MNFLILFLPYIAFLRLSLILLSPFSVYSPLEPFPDRDSSI